MHPHPILMHTLHDDRNRALEAALTRRYVDQADDALTTSRPRHPLVVWVLTLLVTMWGLSTGKARSARV
jgi:hypothetical protein